MSSSPNWMELSSAVAMLLVMVTFGPNGEPEQPVRQPHDWNPLFHSAVGSHQAAPFPTTAPAGTAAPPAPRLPPPPPPPQINPNFAATLQMQAMMQAAYLNYLSAEVFPMAREVRPPVVGPAPLPMPYRPPFASANSAFRTVGPSNPAIPRPAASLPSAPLPFSIEQLLRPVMSTPRVPLREAERSSGSPRETAHVVADEPDSTPPPTASLHAAALDAFNEPSTSNAGASSSFPASRAHASVAPTVTSSNAVESDEEAMEIDIAPSAVVAVEPAPAVQSLRDQIISLFPAHYSEEDIIQAILEGRRALEELRTRKCDCSKGLTSHFLHLEQQIAGVQGKCQELSRDFDQWKEELQSWKGGARELSERLTSSSTTTKPADSRSNAPRQSPEKPAEQQKSHLSPALKRLRTSSVTSSSPMPMPSQNDIQPGPSCSCAASGGMPTSTGKKSKRPWRSTEVYIKYKADKKKRKEEETKKEKEGEE